jgi:hypothetical protein
VQQRETFPLAPSQALKLRGKLFFNFQKRMNFAKLNFVKIRLINHLVKFSRQFNGFVGAIQVCQMVPYIKVPKIPILLYFMGPWNGKCLYFHGRLVHFTSVIYILWPFGMPIS